MDINGSRIIIYDKFMFIHDYSCSAAGKKTYTPPQHFLHIYAPENCINMHFPPRGPRPENSEKNMKKSCLMTAFKIGQYR